MAEVAPSVWAERGFEFGGVAPSGDDVRIGVFFVPSGAEQVADQRFDPRSARSADFSDHRIRFRTCSAAASSRSAADHFRRVRNKIPGTLPSSVQLRHRLVQVDPDVTDRPRESERTVEDSPLTLPPLATSQRVESFTQAAQTRSAYG